MRRPGIAMILYTVRDQARENLPDTLRRVRECGFEYVQWSGMPPMPAKAIRSALEEAGLRAIAAHTSVEPFEEDFEGQVAFWKTVGVRDVAPGGMMRDCQGDLESWLRGAARLDDLGAKLRKAGMRLSYHNHAYEFETFPGDPRCKLDILYEATDPRYVFAELDTCWIYAGGADPAACIRKYAGRCPVIHVKDMKAERDESGRPRFTPLGQGVLDWPAILAAAKESGVEWYVYEQDTFEGEAFECIRASYEFLAQNL